jgi:clathrin heavy chain
MDYVNRLDNYDGADIAKIALSEQYELFEEAFVIYKKFSMGEEALAVLLHNLNDLKRGKEFAEQCDKPATWFLLARAQLDAGEVAAAIDSYLKSDNADHFAEVIKAAKSADCYMEMISYLQMARTHKKDAALDNELLYAFAKTDRLSDLEEFLSVPVGGASALVTFVCVHCCVAP